LRAEAGGAGRGELDDKVRCVSAGSLPKGRCRDLWPPLAERQKHNVKNVSPRLGPSDLPLRPPRGRSFLGLSPPSALPAAAVLATGDKFKVHGERESTISMYASCRVGSATVSAKAVR